MFIYLKYLIIQNNFFIVNHLIQSQVFYCHTINGTCSKTHCSLQFYLFKHDNPPVHLHIHILI
jgi:hypothetical protein